MTKTIRQQMLLPAAPKKVYDALIDEKKHAGFTGAAAKISKKVGGAFSCYDGYITGLNIELVPSKRLVQAWRAQGWPAGTFSLVTFALASAAGGKTKLTFTQLGVPASDYKAKSNGWRTHYWEPLKKFLEG
jgi:uncharacterized protein YndB with AHSA1/START domain